MAAEMDKEATAVGLMVERAMQEALGVDWVRDIIALLRFLRSPDATGHCLRGLYFYRASPPADNFETKVAEDIDLQERLRRLAIRLPSPEPRANYIHPYLAAIRRLDAVRLKRALAEFHPEESAAKV
jgi:hypothetical protein